MILKFKELIDAYYWCSTEKAILEANTAIDKVEKKDQLKKWIERENGLRGIIAKDVDRAISEFETDNGK